MKIPKLQFITQESEQYTHLQQVEFACKGGIEWVQLRVKDKPYEEWLDIAKETKKICDKYDVTLIINDNVTIAREVYAHGVHLGQEDMHSDDARKILGNNFIVGVTANTFEQVKNHSDNGADYIGLGPFRFTKTKLNLSPVIGLEGYKLIMEKCRKENIDVPIFAIGGIKSDDFADILNTGIYGIAISSLIVNSENIIDTTKNIVDDIYKFSVKK